jgi:hypothetical protein
MALASAATPTSRRRASVAADDWARLLCARARELRVGGRLLLTMPAPSPRGENTLRLLCGAHFAQALQDVVGEAEAAGVQWPSVHRTLDEMLAPLRDPAAGAPAHPLSAARTRAPGAPPRRGAHRQQRGTSRERLLPPLAEPYRQGLRIDSSVVEPHVAEVPNPYYASWLQHRDNDRFAGAPACMHAARCRAHQLQAFKALLVP